MIDVGVFGDDGCIGIGVLNGWVVGFLYLYKWFVCGLLDGNGIGNCEGIIY